MIDLPFNRMSCKIIFIIFLLIELIHPCLAATTKHKTKIALHHNGKMPNKAKYPTDHKRPNHIHLVTAAKHKMKPTSHKKHKITSKIPHVANQKKKLHGPKLTKKQSKKTFHHEVIIKKARKTLRHKQNHTAISVKTPPTKINTTHLSETHLPSYLLSAIERNLIHFVRKTIATIQYTTYKLGGTHIDPSRGVYVVDCSTYVDHILKTIYPQAYTSLTTWSGTEKPTTDDFYHYFNHLSYNTKHWNTIDDVEQLRPGDILVFRYKNSMGHETGGHVVVVMDKPIQQGNTFMLRIADSASSGHSKDTRLPHASGIGIGTMLLKVNPKTFQPYAYAWKVGSRWESNVNFAMARPINLS
ncbi:MAG: hypothetical protein KIT56_05525 [Gammaproteobacteria bacterium]|nr:hypothetical protein [Gammaproteobacteria bacterium]MCW5583331.1 hypothetical protein [Gammaproteobacteria bacterium]